MKITYSNESYERQFNDLIVAAYSECQKILIGIPIDIEFSFKNNCANEITGVGGSSISRKIINLAVIDNFQNLDLQTENLRGAIFHELFHIQQDFTVDKQPFNALESAIYEGCGLVFERSHAGVNAAYGSYESNTETELTKWFNEIKKIGIEYSYDKPTWQTWAFYHKEYNEKWIIYKVGSWLIDCLLVHNKLDILDLMDKSAGEIIEMLTDLKI